MHTLKKELDSLIKKTKNKEIVIKPADKGSIIVICTQTIIGIYATPIFQIHHITEC